MVANQLIEEPGDGPHPGLALLPYLLPQQPNVHVSPVVPHNPFWRFKDGTYLAASVRLQFFYNERGTLSFVVISGIGGQRCKRRPRSPPAPPAPTTSETEGTFGRSPGQESFQFDNPFGFPVFPPSFLWPANENTANLPPREPTPDFPFY